MMPDQLNPKPFIAEAEVEAADREYTPTTSIRELTNEFGHKIKIFVREMVDNHIKITIEGPNSISENIVTPREFDQLRSALLDYNITSNLTRTDLMDSDYARDVMKIGLAKTTERAADVIEKLHTALCTLAGQKLSSEMDGHEYINADFDGAYNSLIELARAARSSLNEAACERPLELSEIHIRLLKRGSRSKWIGLSDNAGIHDGEVCALGELERAGLVRATEDRLPPGPPSMKPYEITDAGRAALAKSEG
ncbi:hypothetical protein [Mesorhizobium sp.]|uniref:hypothetical protein n=1 Tax=Mesorhizobium sp. TaxID=1871066 RepID=UPI000FE9B1A9|nr:hypothetical protein [Mesorhizobium sp.]RWF33750.1 MAG: hypothetical protein EOS45_02130 [Mesorhizobium sp.]